MAERPEEELTIAMIAARADVTPSTIYRRWSSLSQLLNDVAGERFVPDSVPPDTGSLRGDLEIWVEQTVDDFSSAALRMLFRERLANKKMAEVAAGYTYMNLLYLCDRCERRGEVAPNPDRLIDLIFAPLVNRMFFVHQSVPKLYQMDLSSVLGQRTVFMTSQDILVLLKLVSLQDQELTKGIDQLRSESVGETHILFGT